MNYFYEMLTVFAVGGSLCALAQILVIKTKIAPPRILMIFLGLGVILQLTGAYSYLYDVSGAGIAVPIVGFGAALAKGSMEWVDRYGIIGALAGGLVQTAYGIGVAVVGSYIAALCVRSRTKR